MTGLPVHYIIRRGGIVADEGMNIVAGRLRGQIVGRAAMDEHLKLWPETNLRSRNIDTVRTIVAKHLPEDGTLPKRNWLQRWFTDPEPQDAPEEYRIVGDFSPIHTEDFPDREFFMEHVIQQSFTDRLVEAQVDAIAEVRREAARDGVFVAVHHLEKHLESLSNETMIDTVTRAATQDCIEILRKLRRDMSNQESGGA